MRNTWWCVVVLAAAALCLRADDFWAKKKFTEWSDKELRQMVMNSPWAQRIDIPLQSARGGGGGKKGGGGGGAGMSAENSIDGGGSGRGGGGGGGMEIAPTLPVLIRWQSALPVRQALAKGQWGNEVTTSPEAAKLLGVQDKYYIISISGLRGGMLGGANPETLKAKTVLKIGKNAPLSPADVKINRGEMAEIFFIFLREGHPIELNDKDVEVMAKIGNIDVRRRFRLKDMVFDGKLEL